MILRALLATVADVVAPRGCAACDAPTARHAIFCWSCAAAVVEPEGVSAGDPALADLVEIHAGASYGGPVATAIGRLKYDRRADLAEPLAHLALRRFAPRPRIVVPVPLHVTRLVERGFNQAALLARPITRHLGSKLETNALERVRATERQATLGGDARRNNVAASFFAHRSRVEGRTVLLVDDVVTTGSTLRAAAQALRDAGAEAVFALVVARAELNSSDARARPP